MPTRFLPDVLRRRLRDALPGDVVVQDDVRAWVVEASDGRQVAGLSMPDTEKGGREYLHVEMDGSAEPRDKPPHVDKWVDLSVAMRRSDRTGALATMDEVLHARAPPSLPGPDPRPYRLYGLLAVTFGLVLPWVGPLFL